MSKLNHELAHKIKAEMVYIYSNYTRTCKIKTDKKFYYSVIFGKRLLDNGLQIT